MATIHDYIKQHDLAAGGQGSGRHKGESSSLIPFLVKVEDHTSSTGYKHYRVRAKSKAHAREVFGKRYNQTKVLSVSTDQKIGRV